MTRTSGGPLPTTRYPTAPSLVRATRTGADTTDRVPGARLCDELHAVTIRMAKPKAGRYRRISITSNRRNPYPRAWPETRIAENTAPPVFHPLGGMACILARGGMVAWRRAEAV